MSLSNEAFTRIREAIVSGKLDFGERLSEMQIAEALEMSKAPVRTAFFKLRDIRLVTIVPQAGTYVFSPRREDVLEMSTFRAVLETAGMRLSMQHAAPVVIETLETTIEQMEKALGSGNWAQYEAADMAFHEVFVRASGNSFLPQAYDLTASAIQALRVRLQGGEGDYRQQSFGEHKMILAALKDGRLDAAARALEDHIMVINEARLHLPEGTSRARARTRAPEEYKALFAG
ncbi:GntR family transcriptional regulator [Citreimonas sp.]|uniref:GntR family transcriptional regulator n=1 Tax=Citreimonas sp. TaxID=3036715 RepID=UPI0035C851FF